MMRGVVSIYYCCKKFTAVVQCALCVYLPHFCISLHRVVAPSHMRAEGCNLMVETEYSSNLEHAHWAHGRCLLGAQPKVLCLSCIASLQRAFG